MKVAAVVPMKLNNRRLPQKNTRPFTNGRPLCWYILSTLLEVEAIEKVYVYCSNPSIREYLPQGVEYLRRGGGFGPGLHQDERSSGPLRRGSARGRVRDDPHHRPLCAEGIHREGAGGGALRGV